MKTIGLFCVIVLALVTWSANAQTEYFWDANGVNVNGSGTWDLSTPNWALSSTLTSSTVAYGSSAGASGAIFAAGPTNMGSFTISVVTANIPISFLDDNDVSGNHVTNLTLNASGGGSLSLNPGVDEFAQNAGVTVTVNCPVVGTGGLRQGGSGSLALYGNNTYSGGTYLTGGEILLYNNNNSFGTGPITNTGTSTGMSVENTSAGLVTLANGLCMSNTGSTSLMNFAEGSTTCTGPFQMLNSTQLKNNAASTTMLTVSGPISGASGSSLTLLCPNTGQITLSGPNTYSGQTLIGGTGATTEVTVSSINSVSFPTPAISSSLGVPSSAANGTIAMGSTSYAAQLVYIGAGETSDRVINLAGTTGGAIIEMDGAGPLVLTGTLTATGSGAKTLTLQGTSTAANSIGAIVNSTAAVSLTKAQAGTWGLTGLNAFTGGITISAGALDVSGSGDLGDNGGNGSYAGAISDGGSFIYNSSASQILSGVISGAGTLTQSGTGLLTLTASNSISGAVTISAASGGIQFGNGSTRDATNGGTVSVGGTGLLVYAPGYGSVTNGKAITGAGNITMNGPADLTLANGVNAVTGIPALVINGGTVTQGSDGNLGAVPGSFTYNDIVLNSGALRGNNANSSVSANRGILLTANSGVGALGADLMNILGVISDGNNGYGITMNATTVSGKTGTVSLQGIDTYTGPTTINSGVLALATNGSISNSTSLTINPGATFDVSNFTNGTPYGYFNLSSATALTASGMGLPVGTNFPAQVATINGNATNFINLGTQPFTLNYNPTNLTGDDLHPALYVSQGTLVLNGNIITLNCSQELGYGAYTLIQQASGNISGTVELYPSGSFSFTNGAVGTLSIVGGAVVLTVAPPVSDANSAYFNNWTPYEPIPNVVYGGTSIVVSGTVSNLNGNVAVTGDTLNVQLQGTATAVPAVIGANGSYTATLTFPGTTKVGYYVITNTYTNTSGTGAGNNFAVDTSTALSITPAALTITADSTTTPYGTLVAGYSGAGSTQFVPTGLQNSETVGTITMTQVMSPAVGGAPAVGTTNTWAGTYTVTPSAAIAGTFTAANYTITYVAGVLTISPDNLTITAGTGASTYGSAATFLVAGKSTNDSPAAPLFAQTGMVNGQSADSITVTLSSTGGTPTSPAFTYALVPSAAGANSSAVLAYDKTNFNVNNYTIAYANGTLTVNPAPATVTALAQTKTYGSTATAGTVTIPSALVSVSTLSNSDTIGSVSLAYSLSGGYTGDQAGAPVSGSPYTITASGAAGGTGDESNYVFAYVPGALTVNPLPVAVYGTKTFDGTTSVDLSTLVVTNAVGSDVVSVTTGPGTMSGTGPGLETITSFGTATLAGAAAGNYTLLGAIGYVLVNSSSPFVITSSALDSTKTNLVVCWNSISNVSYQVLTNTDLTQTNNWTVLGTITATNTTTCFTVPGTTNADAFVLIKHL